MRGADPAVAAGGLHGKQEHRSKDWLIGPLGPAAAGAEVSLQPEAAWK